MKKKELGKVTECGRCKELEEEWVALEEMKKKELGEEWVALKEIKIMKKEEISEYLVALIVIVGAFALVVSIFSSCSFINYLFSLSKIKNCMSDGNSSIYCWNLMENNGAAVYTATSSKP